MDAIAHTGAGWGMGCGIAGWIVLTLLAYAGNNEGLGNLLFWGGAIGFGAAYWNKKAPEREKRAIAETHAVRRMEYLELTRRRDEEKAELARRRDELQSEVDVWRAGGRVRRPTEDNHLPGPAGDRRGGGRSEHVALRPVTLRSGRTLALPDAVQGRQLLGETITDLTRAVAGEARRFVRQLEALPAGGCEPARFRRRGGELGWERPESGTRPTPAAAALVHRALAWSTARQTLLKVLDPAAAELGPVKEAARKAARILDGPSGHVAFPGPQDLPVRPEGEWPAHLAALGEGLRRAAQVLGSRPPFEPIGLLRPPQDARFAADVAPSAVDERLTAFLLDRTRRFARLAAGTVSLEESDWELGGGLLDGFLTTEVAGRFHRTAKGAEAVARLPRDAITADVRRRLNLGYQAIALNYLTEVSFQMQEYTNRSGMGEPRPPVTINGNVGAVNIADTIQFIGSNVAAIMERGDDRSAAAIDALNAAIQQETALSEQQRAELLDSLADVSEAAANPDERRLRTRARLALTAIANAGTAIGATSPIAQAVTDWQHVYTSLF
ncbi:hypothetical protein [Streptomyces sp. G1]|uniref:hypothetical protein n=1 Tax=Streptomyces sp. G1 TaxID=361572 RepID=UPI002030B502|nr:hypothetical protein [Streptomyces sp. G1]MCM1972102.1 hypothetical protein [Streptomyces sp. G1]